MTQTPTLYCRICGRRMDTAYACIEDPRTGSYCEPCWKKKDACDPASVLGQSARVTVQPMDGAPGWRFTGILNRLIIEGDQMEVYNPGMPQMKALAPSGDRFVTMRFTMAGSRARSVDGADT